MLAWLFWLALAGAPLSEVMGHRGNPGPLMVWSVVFVLVGAVSTVSIVMLAIKRLHDLDKPAPLAVCLFVPALSILAFALLCILPGTPGPNPYGPEKNRPRV